MDNKFERDVRVQIEANRRIETEKAKNNAIYYLTSFIILGIIYFIFREDINDFFSEMGKGIELFFEYIFDVNITD